MSINPDNITTIRVDQLAESTLNLTNEFPHSEGATLKKAKIQALVDLVATAVGSGSGVGFLPISVTDGQQLPNVPADPSFFLCGVGTFLNINGYPNIVCTEELNAIMSVSDHWEIAVEIPINVDLQTIGISQSVNNGVLDKAPSENAVYNFISQWLPKSSLGYFDYADLATQTTPITVLPDTQTLLTNDTLGDSTNTSQPPYGVTAIWDADSDEFNFQQLSVGDTVDLRIHLKTTTTTANQKYHIDMKFAFDGPDEFENRIFSQYVKNASEDEQSFVTTLYIGSESVRTYPARLYITSDDDATVEVVGWFCRVFRKSVNIVSVDEAPIDGLTYGRKDAQWVEVSGGGSVGTLQQVTDNGNTTTNAIEVSNHIKASEFRSSADDITFADGSGNPIFFFASTGANQANFDKALLTADRNYSLPDASGTIALTSNIPTVDATPTDGSSNAVSSNGVFDALANKVDANAPITGTIKTKITYDSKGLVTSGADATTADIADSTDKRYVSDAQLTVISNTSGTNTGDNATNSQYSGLATSKQDVLTEVNFGSFSNALTAKTTPVDADTLNLSDSADSNKAKKTTWLNVWLNYLKPKADSLYLIPCITITTSTSIDTDTTGSGYGQHGRNTKISNGANAINLTVQTSSNSDFVASYTKIGSSNITFVAGSGATLVQLSGTAVLSGAVGSTACLTRNGNIYYLQITNY